VIWADGEDFWIEARAGENENRIHTAESGEGVSAVLLGIQRSVISFESTHGGIAVDGDDEQIAHSGGCLEIGDVATMEEVKAAIGQDDLAPIFGRLLTQGEETGEIIDSFGWIRCVHGAGNRSWITASRESKTG
jgi:hypothetical protein